MRRGWLKNGPRTLAEQMQGLQPALAECAGKSVLDLGCAEGLIGLEFLRAGACGVIGIENNPDLVADANAEVGKSGLNMEIWEADLARVIQAPPVQYDIVLALAILHKLHDPAAAAAWCCASARELIVIRLQLGSTGRVRSKHLSYAQCDLRLEMPRHGFVRERKEPGPRGEWVQYWRRAGSR